MVQWIRVGYYVQEEQKTDGKPNGVFVNTPHERRYFATSVHAVQRNGEAPGTLNQKRGLTMDLSILSNPWFLSHMQDIAYVDVLGSKWEIQSIDPQHPRYILNVGGEYHEEN